MKKYKIAILVGSLRKESWNLKVAKTLMALAPASLDMHIIDISNLPIYNEDLDVKPPESWINFRKEIQNFDGVLFITPEYNRSIPAVLKNALDVGSRPYGKSVWDKKPGAVVSASPGAVGGFGANHHLRQCLVFLNVPCMQQPESYIGNIAKIMDEKGNITSEDTRNFLKKLIETYAHWVEIHVKNPCP